MEGVSLKVHIHPDSNYRQHEVDLSNQVPQTKVEQLIKSEPMQVELNLPSETPQEDTSKSEKPSSISDLSGLRTASIIKPSTSRDEKSTNEERNRQNEQNKQNVEAYSSLKVEKFLQTNETLNIENKFSVNHDM